MLVFNFNGVTVRVTYTTKSSKIQSQGRRNACLLFKIDPLSPGSPHPQVLGGGGDRLSLSVMHTDGMKVYRSELVASYVCVLPVSTVMPCKADAKTSISPIFNNTSK